MNLIVFDIDGTLLRSNEADESCIRSALHEEFGFTDISTDWGSYRHSTDSGILNELFERKRGHEPSVQDIHYFQDRFIDHLDIFYTRRNSKPEFVPGSDEVVKILNASSDFRVAIATGGWQRSAQFKLDVAKFPRAGIPASFADDHFERFKIIELAQQRAQLAYQISHFESVCYVGDGRWDFWATQKLGIPFIGVTDTRGEDYLKSHGVQNLVRDFSRPKDFLERLREWL